MPNGMPSAPSGGAGGADKPRDPPFTAGLVPRCSEPSRTHALRAPLRGGLRPSLTAPARREVPEGVGTESRPDLRSRLQRVEQEAANKEKASQLCRALARLRRHRLRLALLTVEHALG